MNLREMQSDPMQFFAELIIPGVHGSAKFGDVMADFQRERFAQIVPALLAVAKGEKPPIGRYWWEATKGASKDSDLACCILWLLAFSPRSSLTIQVGADDRGQANELRKAARDILLLNPWLASRITIQNYLIRCDGSSRECEILSTDATGSHGARPDVLIVNELSHISNQTFAQTLMDNASKMPNGLAVIATNAGHVETWQYDWREAARESPRWIFNKRSEPAPWIDPAEMADARTRNTLSRFNRLWLGVWASGSDGKGLDSEDVEAAVTRKGPCGDWKEEVSIGPFIGALDIGVRRDHASLIILGCQPRKRSVVLADVRSWDPKKFGGRIPLHRVKESCVEAWQRFRLLGIAYDPHQGEYLAEMLANQGLSMYYNPWTVQSKEKMAIQMVEAFSQHLIELYEEEALLRDLSRIVIGERAGRVTIDGPRDEHGHCDRGLALAMALPWAFETKRALIERDLQAGAHPSEYREVFTF